MNYILFILLGIILILLVPIPIKLTLTYEDNKSCLYIYNFKVKLNKKMKSKGKTLKKKVSKISEMDLSDIRLLINRVACSKFKPTIRMNLGLDYGLLDAYSTGLAYGIIGSLSPFIYKMLTIIFKVKKYNMEAKPNFDELLFKMRIKSIIFINLGKIIYILIIILKSLKAIKQKYNRPCTDI